MIETIVAVLGTVGFIVDAKSDFDRWTTAPTATQIQVMREDYARMVTYSPYFDERLDWYPNAWVYQDSMAIIPDWPVYREHPEWVLRDESGRELFIDFACRDGSCPQLAADIGNPAYRAWWIKKASDLIEQAGYRGIWVDDVNLEWRISNGAGVRTVPVDPRTGKKMRLSDWRRHFAEFMEELRAALPSIEIAHNSIWYVEHDEFVERQIAASDFINIERGVSDPGITDNNGPFGFSAFVAFVDRVHAMGRSIIIDDDDDSSDQKRDYDLAFYLLTKTKKDLLSADGDRSRMNPDTFWPGYRLNLGSARGAYFRSGKAYRRNFECGHVIVEPPPRSSGTVTTYDCGRPSPPRVISIK